MVVTPYYNKPTQEGLYQHYKAINNKCGLPIFIYNIPGRSVIDMSVDTMSRLFELKNIAGVKDATGDLNRVIQQRKKLGKDFIQFTGEDSNAYEFRLRGGVGCISVTANVAPRLCSEMQTLLDYQTDKLILQRAKEINRILKPLHDLMFIETNPSPVKYAVSLLKLCSNDLRLPMVTITKKNQIVKLVCQGQSYKMIASETNLSIDGVRYHLQRIYRKLEINSKTELVAIALA